MSDMDWLNEIVFLGLWIIPVYPITLLGDVVIFNTWGYWTGNNPISDPARSRLHAQGLSRRAARRSGRRRALRDRA
jgi:hypothetical protein